jgi:dGTPase
MNWQQLLSSQRPSQKRNFHELSRSAFEQDYDRIIFSHPFRRLQDKTQVHPLPEDDFVHTRLTHSLEVSSVGRSLGKKVGEIILNKNPDLSKHTSLFDFGAIVAAGSLAHDLGNPPFGHSGEDAISDFFIHHPFGKSLQAKVTEAQWADLINFEGNAQGFRILNKKEYGFKLTHATLGAFTKYPCPALFNGRDKSKKSQKKYGFFATEATLFKEVADQIGLVNKDKFVWSRHPLAFLVEAADDICYSIIDLEDGCRLGLLTFDEVIELFSPILKDKLDKKKLSYKSGLNEKLGILRAMVIGDLIEATTKVFIENEENILNGTFDEALTDQCEHKGALKTINKVSVEKIYRARHVVEIEAAGFEILPGLLEEFGKASDALLKKNLEKKYINLSKLFPIETTQAILAKPDNIYLQFREVVDFISGLTDKHALSLYRKIKGFEI